MICIASSKHGIILQSEVASVGVLADLVKRIWSAVSVILVARSWVDCSYGPTPMDFYVTIPYYSSGPIGFYVAFLYDSLWPVGLFLWASISKSLLFLWAYGGLCSNFLLILLAYVPLCKYPIIPMGLWAYSHGSFLWAYSYGHIPMGLFLWSYSYGLFLWAYSYGGLFV